MATHPTTLKVPKRIPIEVLRKVMGDKRTEDFLTMAFGPNLLGPAAIRIERHTFEQMLSFFKGNERKGLMQAVPAIFRLYYREVPHAQRRFVRWMEEKVAAIEEAGPEGQVPGLVVKAVSPAAHTERRKPGRPRKHHVGRSK